MSPPWIDRCPEGHASVVRHHRTGTYQCKTCSCTYEGEPFDARETEFPVDGPHPLAGECKWFALTDILQGVVEISDRPDRHWVKTYELDAPSTHYAAKLLGSLEDRGWVTRRAMSEPVHDCWRPTDAGRDRVEVVADV